MFVGSLGTVYAWLSQFWIPGFILIVAGLCGPYATKRLTASIGRYLIQWGCLLVCIGYAWQSLNQILWGVLVNGEIDIGIGMVRYMLIIMPVLLIQIILFLRRDFAWLRTPSTERVRLYLLGGGIMAAFYSTIAAYKLADIGTITDCLYVAPPGYQFSAFNDWAKSLCR